MNIVQILKDRRIELGVSQEELATHCGFRHRSSVSLLEDRQRQWKFEDILAACKLLKLEIRVIYNED